MNEYHVHMLIYVQYPSMDQTRAINHMQATFLLLPSLREHTMWSSGKIRSLPTTILVGPL